MSYNRIVERAISLLNLGMSVHDVANEVGISYTKLSCLFRDVGLPNPYSYAMRARVRNAHELRKSGHTIDNIAKRIGVTNRTVYRYLSINNPDDILKHEAHVRYTGSIYDKVATNKFGV